MNTLGIPAACESVAVICDNTSRQLRSMAQSIVRPDLNSEAQRPVTLAAIKSAREALQEVERMLAEPSKSEGPNQ